MGDYHKKGNPQYKLTSYLNHKELFNDEQHDLIFYI